jgi:hypothetical protein
MNIFTVIKFPVVILLLWALSGCVKDKCTRTVFSKIYAPVQMAIKDLQASARSESPKEILATGKIYTKDQYLFVSEPRAGIHIIDNTNPAAPQKIAFLKVLGNMDIAVKGNMLYADSYTDLTVFDISDPRHITLVKRVPEAISYPTDVNGMTVGWKLSKDSIVVGYTYRDTAFTYSCVSNTEGIMFNDASLASAYNKAQTSSGKGGSMARFSIVRDYLYTVNTWQLRTFDISDASNPVFKTDQVIGGGIETIFPYKDYLFIGSQNAMYIYDLTNPVKPAKRSAVTHFRACDPVVVEGNKAYVTVRSGVSCGGVLNQLLVFDITNVDSPVKLATYEMKHPFGVGIDHGNLFICEGGHGLRFLNAADASKITTTKLVEGVETYDVIPFENQHRLLVSAKDGIYQYDYQNMSNPQLLSKINVKRP